MKAHETMPGKHSLDSGFPSRQRVLTIDMVDVESHLMHLMTPDALDAGRLPRGCYIALCGEKVLPAALVDPGEDYCMPCRRTRFQKNTKPARRWWKRSIFQTQRISE